MGCGTSRPRRRRSTACSPYRSTSARSRPRSSSTARRPRRRPTRPSPTPWVRRPGTRSSTCARRSRRPGWTGCPCRRPGWPTTPSAPERFTDLRVARVGAGRRARCTPCGVRTRSPSRTAQLGGSYLPRLEWSAGRRLTFALGLSDLNAPATSRRGCRPTCPSTSTPSRWTSAVWGPRCALGDHQRHGHGPRAPITGRSRSRPGSARCRRCWRSGPPTPSRRAPARRRCRSREPGHHRGLAAGRSAVDLATQIDAIRGFLIANENDYGPYLHGHRYVAFFHGRRHGVRGGHDHLRRGPSATRRSTAGSPVGSNRPLRRTAGGTRASRRYHDDGADDAVPLDFTAPPVVLCSRDPWQRHTPYTAYSAGSALFQGLAALLGAATLNAQMRSLYEAQAGTLPVSTRRSRSTSSRTSATPGSWTRSIASCTGCATRSPAPDLWLRDPAATRAGRWAATSGCGPATTAARPTRTRGPVRTTGSTHGCATGPARGPAALRGDLPSEPRSAGTEFVYPGDFFPAAAAERGVRPRRRRHPRRHGSLARRRRATPGIPSQRRRGRCWAGSTARRWAATSRSRES